jgi:hypothetical protein
MPHQDLLIDQDFQQATDEQADLRSRRQAGRGDPETRDVRDPVARTRGAPRAVRSCRPGRSVAPGTTMASETEHEWLRWPCHDTTTPWLYNQQSALCLGHPAHRPLPPPTRRCLPDIDIVLKEAWIKLVCRVHVLAKRG